MSKTKLAATVISALLVISLVALHFYRNQPTGDFFSLLPSQKNMALKPVGKIIKGTRFVQKVKLKKLRNYNDTAATAPVCLDIMLAGYENSSITGHVRVILILDSLEFPASLNAGNTKKWVFHRVLMPGLTISKLYMARRAFIVLQGIDIPGKAAVTAISTKDLSLGRLIEPNPEFVDRSLMFHIGLATSSHERNRKSAILAAIMLTAVFVIILQSVRRNQ